MTLVPMAVSDLILEQAHHRVPRDSNDAPTLALALQCSIWIADQDFFSCGVPVWTTETLRLHFDQRA